ncbi:MAG: hypothetical protein M3N19_01530 [Candidatus Eremiobacteraeota bacterium]|nr:hypothetical protein [Candidatus Eremiobacteraeota bacterium]
MNFLYDFIAGNSRVTPFGVLATAAVTFALVRAGLPGYAGIALVVLLVATLAGGVFEKER